MARYHAIVNGGTIPVYSRSDCPASAHSGDLYYGEVFTDLGITTGYRNVHEIRFLNPSGQYVTGFIQQASGYGNLAYSGTWQNMRDLGGCYAFRLRKGLDIVNNSNARHTILGAGNMIYTVNATAGATDAKNMAIIGYNEYGNIVKYNGFVKLDYTSGSMFATNFCLMK